MKRSFFDFDSPFYTPWVRLLILCVCFGWALVEMTHGNRIWAALFAALGLYCFWGFYGRKPRNEDQDE